MEFIMKCPNFTNFQSQHKGQKRIDYAIDCLGEDVVNRLLAFSLYLFGFPYEYISNNAGFSKAGLKTLAQQINTNGIDRFKDKRRKNEYNDLIPSENKGTDFTVIRYSKQDNDYMKFEIDGNIIIKIQQNDILGMKILTLLLMEAGLLKQKEVANILDCQRLTVRNNFLKFKTSGTKGLIDNRSGQTRNYKFDMKVIFEIIKKFISCAFDMKTPSKTVINKHLNEIFPQNFSERATALHIKKLGLTDHKKDLFAEIVRLTNEQIDKLEYLEVENKPVGAKLEWHIEMLKEFKNEIENCLINKGMNFFQIEQRIEDFTAELQVITLEFVLTKINKAFSQCPKCLSNNVIIYKGKNTKELKYSYHVKTSLGNNLYIDQNLLPRGRCNNCNKEFDISKDILKLSEKIKFTPLAQKKICSANLAGSYLNAVRNLNELTNLDLNRNQVRIVSMHVGEFIKNEFDELYIDIQEKSPEVISKKHPLIKELRINKKYLDKSKYLIVLAVDGGRMQMFDLISPKKKMRWVETKIFRISIYDKTNLCDVSCDKDEGKGKEQKKYKSARLISGLTTYGATNKNWEDTGPLIISHLYMRGLTPEDIEVCISDESIHIQQKIFLPLFPKSVHILDYYHKTEALYKCLKTNNTLETLQKLKKYLWEGKIDDIIYELKQVQLKVGKPDEKKRKSDDPKVILDNYINHLSENKDRLQYKKFRILKYPIGSGCVESAVKLFGKRIKGTETQWSEEGAEAILHLYSFLLSEDERWKKLWENQNPWM